MRRSKDKARTTAAPERVNRHPDPGIDLQLQRIWDLRQAIARQDALAIIHRDGIEAAHRQQDAAGSNLRGQVRVDKNDLTAYEQQMAAQADRISAATIQLTAIETAIDAKNAEIAQLAGKLSDADLAYL